MLDSESEEPGPGQQEPEDAENRPRRAKRWRVLGVLGGISLLALGTVWVQREQIADRIITGQLKTLDLPATYKIESVGPRRQVLTNIVIGDPARPDMTIERAEVFTEPTFGLPAVGRVKLVRPRIYGTYRNAKASFGVLDKLLFAQSTRPPGLPDLDLELVDGRARFDSDYGVIGIKAEGRGNLKDGFQGIVAAVAPGLSAEGCTGRGLSLYGKVDTAQGKAHFAGPLRGSSFACPQRGLTLAGVNAALDVTSSAAFDGLSGKLGLTSGALGWQGARAQGLAGTSDFTLRPTGLTARYRIEGRGIASDAFGAARLLADGMVRSREGFARLESEGTLEGSGIAPGKGLDAALGGLVRSGEGTLLAPLAGQFRQALAREVPGSRLSASYTLRQNGELATLVIPRASLTGRSGTGLLTLTRTEVMLGGKTGPRLWGNVLTGGPGIPVIEGQIARQAEGRATARLRLAEYRAGDSRLAMPELVLVQEKGGAIGFSGRAELSGLVPGGRIDSLLVPIDGTWSQRAGLAAWRRCTPLRFNSFELASLTLDRRELTVCPGREGAILRSDARGLRIAGGMAGFALAGRLGSSPLRLTSGPAGFAWPGALAMRNVGLSLGDPAAPTVLQIADLKGQLGSAMEGTFAGTEFHIAAVPLDVFEAAGKWRFAGGNLDVSEARLRVEDRQVDGRFRPLIARDATLSLQNGRIAALALLREPKSERQVVEARIAHDTGTGTGRADLEVPGILFDNQLQPDTLSTLALGVIANARGTLTGKGEIVWNAGAVTSNGRFSTTGLDFAAAFGPVKGTSGTVVFTDLLGLVTAPDQRLKIASINPGIEVMNGEASFALEGNGVLAINGARWPFVDGTLELLPTRMVFGAAEVRRYTLRLQGADAAKFVQQLDLGNLSANGVFDGDLPLVFDENGGRIDGGMLVSRPGGGNLSYVGELTYKDLSPMGNFAFQTLRSIDYRKMTIGMDGPLEGELVTRVKLTGVTQGAGAKRNFITRRFARLPIQFNINIRAPFQKLIGSYKSIYDPTFIRDPRSLGLVDGAGRPVNREKPPAPPSTPRKTGDIQPPVSRDRP
ncbi:YdbH domain-containing protein [Novosphingobium sp.]|uniref:intermembrane phospholipid transport protein YdbH family protein n=1 Tax=Novosphingobium sp. TaxID=1874826 RepID=UPI001EB6B150|nr:YdbH domain-containing protein [Novosphingobium sp.]MBK6801716.1 YdbH domain-containing protein [Novosphingobium sp.]MBK9010443.1 YdbH domain-containing protein [Novosphingobium sp.]